MHVRGRVVHPLVRMWTPEDVIRGAGEAAAAAARTLQVNSSAPGHASMWSPPHLNA